MRKIIAPAIFLASTLALTTAGFAATTTPAPAPITHQQRVQNLKAREALQDKRAKCRDEFRGERSSAGLQKFMKACVAKG